MTSLASVFPSFLIHSSPTSRQDESSSQQGLTNGSILIRPVEAKLYRDVELFKKMDPYCLMTMGDYSIKGTVCKNGGKRPFWDDIIVFRMTNEPVCVLELMDKDMVTADDMIGMCEIDIQEVEDNGHVLKWYELHYKRKLAGEILLEIFYEPDNDAPISPLLYVGKNLVEKDPVRDRPALKAAEKHIIGYTGKPLRPDKGILWKLQLEEAFTEDRRVRRKSVVLV